MTSRALVVALFALPLAAIAQVGGQAAPAPTDTTVVPAPQPGMAEPQAVPPPPAMTAPQEAPPPAPVVVAPPPTPPPAPTPTPAQAEPAGQRRESKWRASASIGAGSSYGNTYFLVGARIGRELAAGLALEIDGQYWAGESPSLGKIAPGLTWYSPFRVYVGAYYARWFVGSGFPDQDAVGGRAGYTLISRGRTFAGVGISYERALDCSNNCDSWWPEASVGVSF
jgi:hypothetical protein